MLWVSNPRSALAVARARRTASEIRPVPFSVLSDRLLESYARQCVRRLMHAMHMQLGTAVCLCASPCTTPSAESNLDAIKSKY